MLPVDIETILLAAEATEVIAGASGWAGTVSLGSVLAWLFFRYIPDKDRQIQQKDRELKEYILDKDKQIRDKDDQLRVFIEAKDKQIHTLIHNFNDQSDKSDRERRADYKSALQVVVDHCQRESEIKSDMMARQISEISEAIKDFRLTMEEQRTANIAQMKYVTERTDVPSQK